MIRCRFCEMSCQLQGIPIITNILQILVEASAFMETGDIDGVFGKMWNKCEHQKKMEKPNKQKGEKNSIVNLSVEISMQNTSESKYDKADRNLNLMKHAKANAATTHIRMLLYRRGVC